MDLSRFTVMHKQYYDVALREVKSAFKINHWMWYIFPQIKGLGSSPNSLLYAINDVDEAKAFLDDPYLGQNLIEISSVLLKLDTNDPVKVFGIIDAKKLKSSMTLFSLVADDNSVFHQVLEKYFNGKCDYRTLRILGIDK